MSLNLALSQNSQSCASRHPQNQVADMSLWRTYQRVRWQVLPGGSTSESISFPLFCHYLHCRFQLLKPPAHSPQPTAHISWLSNVVSAQYPRVLRRYPGCQGVIDSSLAFSAHSPRLPGPVCIEDHATFVQSYGRKKYFFLLF